MHLRRLLVTAYCMLLVCLLLLLVVVCLLLLPPCSHGQNLAVCKLLTIASFCTSGRYVSGMSFIDHTAFRFGSSWKYGWNGLAGLCNSAQSLAAAEPQNG